jgi:hypothetical protein
MDYSFSGFGENAATFAAQSGVAAGMPVKLAASGTVCACAAGDSICGVALNVRDGMAAVQLSGYVCLPYDGTVPAVGWQNVAAAADGKAAVGGTSGRQLLILDVDEASKTFGVIL